MDYYKFYELYTEFGTLLIYEKYKGEREAFPETREFFTNEKAKPGYDTLTFNNGKSSFRTRKRKMQELEIFWQKLHKLWYNGHKSVLQWRFLWNEY